MENVLQECAELVDELNSEFKDNKYLSNEAIGFHLIHDGYTTSIMLGDITFYNSENERNYEYSDDLSDYIEVPIKQFVLRKIRKMLFELRKISFYVNNQLKVYELEEDNSSD